MELQVGRKRLVENYLYKRLVLNLKILKKKRSPSKVQK